MSGNSIFLGIVRDGKFIVLEPYRDINSMVRLTSIPMQAAQPSESAELYLDEYEGNAIMVSGRDGGGWIYSAEIVDKAGPILTAVVEQVFGQNKVS